MNGISWTRERCWMVWPSPPRQALYPKHQDIMTESKSADINDKLFAFLRDIKPRQFQWIAGLQHHAFNPTAPEEDVFPLVVEALMAGMRSSTARLLIEDRLRAN